MRIGWASTTPTSHSPLPSSLAGTVLVRGFLDADASLRAYMEQTAASSQRAGGGSGRSSLHGGCTACTALVTPAYLLVANAGDSRSVLVRRGGAALPLSRDHKPTDPAEAARVEAAGE
jgi:serine/threonine protein phosphatase PrpC